LNNVIDVVIGTAVCYLLLVGVERLFDNCEALSFRSGSYGTPAVWNSWVYQAAIWIVLVLIMKIIVIAAEVIFEGPMGVLGKAMLFWLDGYPKLELIFVMIIFPVILNSLMFWVTDSFLKSNTKSEGVPEPGIEFNNTPLLPLSAN
jgi:hypothetical protein